MITTLFLAGDYRPDACGVVHYTQRLRRELRELGVESSVVMSREAAKHTSAAGVRGVTAGWGAGCLGPLLRSICRAAPDIVHPRYAPGSYRFKRAITFLPLLLRTFCPSVPIVTTLHEYGDWDWQPAGAVARVSGWLQRRGWWDPEVSFITSVSDALIVTTPDPERLIVPRLPRAAGRLARIPIATNVDRVACSHAEARQAVVRRTG